MVYTRIPSANRSAKNPNYDKMPMLAFQRDPSDYFGYKKEARYIHGYDIMIRISFEAFQCTNFELSFFFSYRCSTPTPTVPDVGSRVLGGFT